MLSVTERSIVAPECGLPMKGRLHGSLSSGTTCETRVSGTDAGAIRASQGGGQGLAPGRNLHADRLSPEGRDPVVGAAGGDNNRITARSPARLWARGRGGVAHALDCGGLALVGAVEGPSAGVGAVGATPAAVDGGDGAGAPADQCAADRPPASGRQADVADAEILPHPTRHPA